LPTLCEWCDVELPDVKLDGISVAEILAENRGSQRDTFYWQMGNGRSPQWAVRKGNWKLIGNPRDTTLPQTEQINGGRLEESMFLVDLETDPGEQANLANSHPEKLAELKRLREQLVEGFETVSSE
jgi:arylsulfatase A-like enzyme